MKKYVRIVLLFFLKETKNFGLHWTLMTVELTFENDIGNVSIDTTELNRALQKISIAIHQQELKLNELQGCQDEGKKEFDALRSSIEQKIHRIDEYKNIEGNSSTDFKVEPCDASEDHDAKLDPESKDSIMQIRKELVRLKTTLKNIVQEMAYDSKQYFVMEKRIDDVMTSLVSLERANGKDGTFHVAIKKQRESMIKEIANLQNSLTNVEEAIRAEVELFHRQNAQEIRERLHHLEQGVLDRQSQLNDRINLVAKQSDFDALSENISNELKYHHHRVNRLEQDLVTTKQSLLSQRSSRFQSCIIKTTKRLERRLMKEALVTFKHHCRIKAKEDMTSEQRQRILRKLSIRIRYIRKCNAWKKWRCFDQNQRQKDLKRLKAVKIMLKRANVSNSERFQVSFNHWRRIVIASKIQEAVTCNTTPNGPNERLRLDTKGNSQRQSLDYDLPSLIKTFQGDQDGAIQTIAQELHNVKKHELSKLRKHFLRKVLESDDALSTSISDTQDQIQNSMTAMKHELHNDISSLSSKLPIMKSELTELRDTLQGVVHRVKETEKCNKEQIAELCQTREDMSQEISQMQIELKECREMCIRLNRENALLRESIQTTNNRMETTETQSSKRHEDFMQYCSQNDEDIHILKKQSDESRTHMNKLNAQIVETRADLIQAKHTSSSNLKDIHSRLDSHGIPQPKWEVVLKSGVRFETVASKKNYIVPINGVMNEKSDIDLSSIIASFSHDYAKWISYQADYEALRFVVIGKNPDDDTPVQDLIEQKRKQLVQR